MVRKLLIRFSLMILLLCSIVLTSTCTSGPEMVSKVTPTSATGNSQCVFNAIGIDTASVEQNPSVQSTLQSISLSHQNEHLQFTTTLDDGFLADVNCNGELEAVLLSVSRSSVGLGYAHILSFALPTWTLISSVEIPFMWEGQLSYVDLTNDSRSEVIIMGMQDSAVGGNHPPRMLRVISTSSWQIIGEWDVYGQIDLQDLNQNGVPEVTTVDRLCCSLYDEFGQPQSVAGEWSISYSEAFRGKLKAYEWNPQLQTFTEYTLPHAALVNSALQSIVDVYRRVDPPRHPLAFAMLEDEYGPEVLNEALQTFRAVEEHRPQIRSTLLSSDKSVAEAMGDVGNIIGTDDQEVLYSIVSAVMADEFVVNPAGEIQRFRDLEYSILQDIARREFKNTVPSPMVSAAVEILADYKGVPLTEEEKYFVSVAITYAGKQVLLSSTDNMQTRGGRIVYVKRFPDGNVLYIPTLTEAEQQQIANLMTATYQAYKAGNSVEFLSELMGETMQFDISSLDIDDAEKTLQKASELIRGFAGSDLLDDLAQSLNVRVPETYRRPLDSLFDWP